MTRRWLWRFLIAITASALFAAAALTWAVGMIPADDYFEADLSKFGPSHAFQPPPVEWPAPRGFNFDPPVNPA